MSEHKFEFEIPEHEHAHSLYIHCLDCFMFGIPLPSKFSDNIPCGNCHKKNTIKYFPPCCLLAHWRPLIENAPMVTKSTPGHWWEKEFDDATHKARLVMIEEIK